MTSSLVLPSGFSTHRHNGDPSCMHLRWWIGYHDKAKGETFVGCHSCSAASFITDQEVMAEKAAAAKKRRKMDKQHIKVDWDRLAKQMRATDGKRILDRNGKKAKPVNLHDKARGLA